MVPKLIAVPLLVLGMVGPADAYPTNAGRDGVRPAPQGLTQSVRRMKVTQ
ncbi:hypothetical protein [Nonomuraea basaltis]|nr:hypothetical protein [Nonomuraea basaltis]